jgi:hypothetical protein
MSLKIKKFIFEMAGKNQEQVAQTRWNQNARAVPEIFSGPVFRYSGRKLEFRFR